MIHKNVIKMKVQKVINNKRSLQISSGFFSCINRYKTKQSNSHKLNAQLVNVVTSFNMNYLSFFLFLNIYRGIYLKVFKLKIYRFINNMSVIAYTILKDLRLIAGYRFIIFTQKI